jgi:hypothetical protein
MKNENISKLIVVLIAIVLTYVIIIEPLISMVQTTVNQIGVGLQ